VFCKGVATLVSQYKVEKIVIRLSTRLKQKLQKRAEKRQMTVSELIRLLIEQEVEEKQR
jgi:predicted DNA-binding protein